VAKRRSFRDRLGKNDCGKSRLDLKNIGCSEKLAEIHILEDDNLRAPIDSVALSVTWTLPRI